MMSRVSFMKWTLPPLRQHRPPPTSCRQLLLRRSLHLAPPFLLDEYTPRYMSLSQAECDAKRSLAEAHLRDCNLCPRLCGVNRYETTGVCLIGEKAKVNVVAPHFGEGQYSLTSGPPCSFRACWLRGLRW